MVLGIRRIGDGRLYNSLILLGAEGQVEALYDKHHLVPFGEYIPLGDLAARWGIHGLAAGEGDGYSPGPGPRLITLPEIGPAVPLICYEAALPRMPPPPRRGPGCCSS
ncbi:MAG: nitrilase-related carbon-nitrogen hydrolase [Paracoccaceae bacterium]